MNKINHILKAAVVIGIALAFIMPGAAFFADNEVIDIESLNQKSIKKNLPLSRGWVEQSSNFWEPHRGINYMHAVDANIVWAVAYDGSGANLPVQEFTKTTDGGENWEADSISEAPDDGEASMICAVDQNHAWVPFHSGDPQGIWATTDGGDTWTQQTTALFSGDGAFPNIVHFWDENNGWCQGDPVDGYYEMYTTTNGGVTWTRVPEGNIPAPLAGEYGVVGYYDVVGDTVWWGTTQGFPLRVFKSTDKGLHWTVADTPFEVGSYIDIRFKDQNNGLAMDKNFETPVIAETSDGGSTWDIISYTGTCYGADFDYVPGTDNMYVSTGVNANDPLWQGASYTNDGGHSWTMWSEVSGVQLFGTTWVAGIIGWAGNFNEDEDIGGVYKYTPGGTTADLECEEGDLTWNDVKPGDTVEGTITIRNVGNSGTELDWEISSEPSWGSWTFDPDSGMDLTPEDGDVEIEVSCVAPDDKNEKFTGRVKVQNTENPDDYCNVAITLYTPASKQPFMFKFLQNLIQSFPILEKILTVFFVYS